MFAFINHLFLLSHYFVFSLFFFFNDTATTEIYTLSLHDALPILAPQLRHADLEGDARPSRRLLENHREALPTERFVRLPGLRAILDVPRKFEEADEIVLHVEHRDEIALRAHGPPAHSRVRTKPLCIERPRTEASNKVSRIRERGAKSLEGRRATAFARGSGDPKEKDQPPRRHPGAGPGLCGRHRGDRLSAECPGPDRRDGRWNRPPARRVPPPARADDCPLPESPEMTEARVDPLHEGRTGAGRRATFPVFGVRLGRPRNSSEWSSCPISPSRYEVTCLPSRA